MVDGETTAARQAALEEEAVKVEGQAVELRALADTWEVDEGDRSKETRSAVDFLDRAVLALRGAARIG